MSNKFFDKYGNLKRDIPMECVEDCSHSGECYEDCFLWVRKLKFQVQRKIAIQYLKETGAWEQEELEAMSTEDLSIKILWMACNDITEHGEWFGMNY